MAGSWNWHEHPLPLLVGSPLPSSPAASAASDLIYHSEGGSGTVRSPGTASLWPHLIEIQAQQTLHTGKWLLGTRNK